MATIGYLPCAQGNHTLSITNVVVDEAVYPENPGVPSKRPPHKGSAAETQSHAESDQENTCHTFQ